MGNPIQDAENALGEIINNVQTLRTEFEQDIIQPLQEFPKTDVDALDTTHDLCVQAVQTAMGKLYGPGGNFQGKLADSVASLIGDYFTQENKLNSYASNTVSDYMIELEQLCKSTINDMQPHLDALKGIPNSNIVVSDIINYWSDVFHKGPQELILGLQIGPWKLGDFPPAQYLMQSSAMMPQSQVPASQSPVTTSFLDMVAGVLAPLAAVIIVVNIVTEAIKQLKLDWDMSSLDWSLLQWIQQMNHLHDQVLAQNTSSSLPAKPQDAIRTATNSDIIVLNASRTQQIMKSWQKSGYNDLTAFCTNSNGYLDRKQRDNTNYGGGYLQVYDQNGNLIKINGNAGLQSPTFFSPWPVKPGQTQPGHVEEQAKEWAIEQINAYNQAHPNDPIASANLSIFTYKAPCTAQQKNCAANLSKVGNQKSPWEQDIYNRTKPPVDTNIDVWTANNTNNPKAVKPWP